MWKGHMIALWGEAVLLILGYECNSPVAPSDIERLTSGYRLTQTALYGAFQARKPHKQPVQLPPT